MRWRCVLMLLFALASLGGTGCRTPRYPLSAFAAPAPAPFSVTVLDARPKWQHRYYRGAATPFIYWDAITSIPAERLSPSPWMRLIHEVQVNLSALPTPPEHVQIEVKSFVLVSNDVERLEKMQQCKPDLETDTLDSLEGDAAWEFFQWGFIVPSLEAGRYFGHAVGLFPGLPGPPKALRSGMGSFGPGLTSELDARVTLVWPDGRTSKFDVGDARTAEVYFEGARYSSTVRTLAEGSLIAVGEEIAQHAASPVYGDLTKSDKQPFPMWKPTPGPH